MNGVQGKGVTGLTFYFSVFLVTSPGTRFWFLLLQMCVIEGVSEPEAWKKTDSMTMRGVYIPLDTSSHIPRNFSVNRSNTTVIIP